MFKNLWLKFCLMVGAVLSIPGIAEAGSGIQGGQAFGVLIIMMIIWIIVMLILREVYCWYSKINLRIGHDVTMIQQNARIIELLENMEKEK